MSSPRSTALLDQADAATAHANRLLHAAGQATGVPVRWRHFGPILRNLIDQLAARGITGQLGMCPHLTWERAAPTWWLPYAPATLRCAACTATTAAAIHGTDEDGRCDGCRRHATTLHPTAATLPAVVLDEPGHPTAALPPVTVVAGLCADCKITEEGRP